MKRNVNLAVEYVAVEPIVAVFVSAMRMDDEIVVMLDEENLIM